MIDEKLFAETVERAKEESFDLRAGHPLKATRGFEKATEEDLKRLKSAIERKTAKSVTLTPRGHENVVGYRGSYYGHPYPIMGDPSFIIEMWEVHIYGHNLSDVW